MSEVNGSSYIVAIDPAGGTTYKLIVCLTSNTLTTGITELDASSKCSPSGKWIPGTKIDQTISGQANLLDPDTGTPTNIGFPELYSLMVQGTIVTCKFGKVSPTTGEATYAGTAFITKCEEIAPFDGLITFSFTLRSAAPPFTQTVIY